jgi:hypothetical protein
MPITKVHFIKLNNYKKTKNKRQKENPLTKGKDNFNARTLQLFTVHVKRNT